MKKISYYRKPNITIHNIIGVCFALLFSVACMETAFCEDFQETFSPGWHLITIPCAPSSSDPTVVFASPFEEVVGIEYDGYVYPEDMTEVAAGKAYWAYFTSTTTVTISGDALTGGTEDLTLSPGWNMIGSPFEISSWSDAMIGGVPAGESDVLESGLFYYDAASGGYIEETSALSSWRGYFVKVGGTGTVTLEVPNGGTIIPQGTITGTANLEGLSDHTGININIDPDAEGDSIDIASNSSGAFSKSALAVGGYTVTASYSGFTNDSTHIDVLDGESTDTGLLLLEDTSYPLIASLVPADGATVETATPTMSATFSDTGAGIATSTVKITVGGTDVTGSSSILDMGFTYTPSAAIEDGAVTLVVEVADRAGNQTSATSTFTIDTGGAVDPDQPSNVVASECEHGSLTLLCITWDAPEDPSVTGYNIYVYHETEDIQSPYNGERPVPVSRYTVGGLTPGESYGIEITAVVEEGGLVVEESAHTDRASRSTVANSGNQAVVSFRAISESGTGSSRVAAKTSGNLLSGLVAVASAAVVITDANGVSLATATTGEFGWVEVSALDAGTYNMEITDDGGTPDPGDDIFIEKDDIELGEGEVYVIATAYLDMNGWGEFCGDGIANACEECDDGNRDDGDGCSATCMDETPDASRHEGGICEDTTWYLADSPHIVEGPVFVRGFNDPTLTIEAGCEVKFDSGATLIIGTKRVDGGLIADGSGGAITFTSNEAVPSPGDWDGIVFGPKTLNTGKLDNVTVEYAGGSTGASIYVGGEIDTFTDSTIQSGSGTGVYFADGGYVAGGFATNTVTTHSQNPVTVYADYVNYLLGGNTLTGNSNDVIKVESDVVTTTSHWRNFGVPYEIEGDMWVYEDLTIDNDLTITARGDIYVGLITGLPVFTIGSGVTMKFDSGAGLNIGVDSGTGNFDHATLVADGTDGAITFTSSSDTPAAGDWKGIHLGEYTKPGTIIDNAVIEYAGSVSTASVIVEGEIDYIRNTNIRNGGGIGVDFKENGYADYGFATNTITGHALRPINIYANSVPCVEGSNTITGNGEDIIRVEGGTASVAGTWPNLGVPYEVYGNVAFDEATTFDPDLTLTFDGDVAFNEDGTFGSNVTVIVKGNVSAGDFIGRPIVTIGAGGTWKFDPGTKMEIGIDEGNSDDGGMIANGASGTITFTSNSAVPAAGDWEGITFGTRTRPESLLDNVVIEYAGNSGAALTVMDEVESIDNTTVQYSGGVGMDFQSGGYTGTSFASNTITGNDSYPINIYAGYVADIAAGNTFTGNATDGIRIMGGTVVAAGTWLNHGVPYVIENDVLFERDVTFADNLTVIAYGDIQIGQWSYLPKLTVGAGSTLKFASGAGIDLLDTLRGRLYADGTSSTITFTSNQASPSAGDWAGITFGVDTYSGTVINNCVISYGGANGYGNIYLNDTATNVSITNNTISNSSTYGVYVDVNSTFDPTEETTNTFSGNASGDVFRE